MELKPGTIRWGWWSFSEALDLWLGIIFFGSGASAPYRQFLEEEFWKELNSGQLLDNNHEAKHM